MSEKLIKTKKYLVIGLKKLKTLILNYGILITTTTHLQKFTREQSLNVS